MAKSGYYEVDYVQLYNFMADNDLKAVELSQMLGKEAAYISGVMTKHRKVSGEVLDKICDLMGKTREEVIAKDGAPFAENVQTEKKSEYVPIKDIKEEDVNYVPTFEERMMEKLKNDHERRERFVNSEAYKSEVERGNDVLRELSKEAYKDKWEAFVDFVCASIKDCKKTVKVVDLVEMMLK